MNSKLSKTILLALAIGFFVLWILEFRRAGLAESYWLLLLSIICLLVFQFTRLKAAADARQVPPPTSQPKSKTRKVAKK